jgi:hypothetical protein
MGKIFLFIIAIILGIIFSLFALLGLLRRFLMGFVPKTKQTHQKDTSIIYDDGKTTVHTSKSHARRK